jgi:hypothetical protein
MKTILFIITGALLIAGCKKSDTNPVSDNNIIHSSWSRTFSRSDHDGGCSVQQVSDGGYIVLGQTMPSDFWLIKTDARGDSLWDRRYGGSNDEFPTSLLITGDGGFILSGITYSFGAGASDSWLVKVDSQGTELWAHAYGSANDDNFNYVDQTQDGGFIACGYTNSIPWLVKTDGFGITQWEKYYVIDSTSSGTAGSVTQTPDGGFLLTVFFNSASGDSASAIDIIKSVWLIKTNSTGDTAWTKFLPLPDHSYSVTLKSAGDGGYVILAASFIKIDADGNIVWTRDISGTSIARTSDGGYIAIANSKGNYQLVKTDQNGILLWSKDLYYGSHVEQTTDGGYIVTGLRVSGTKGETALTLIKTDKDGNVKE